MSVVKIYQRNGVGLETERCLTGRRSVPG